LARQRFLFGENMKIVVVTGGFDPIHSGHIEYFRAAKALGDQLIVGVNSDAWLERKKGRAFMPYRERSLIVSAIDCVDAAYQFDDSDGSACSLLAYMKKQYPYAEIIFANGGDRTAENIPEMTVEGVTFAFGVGGENKANSSSWILDEWKAPKTERPWGYYRVLHEVPGTKVKELTVNPGQSLSMQRHALRAEYWHVAEGQCIVEQQMENGYMLPALELSKHKSAHIPTVGWHRLYNPFPEPCKIVEIQYGFDCIEEDIERR
jgi:cytidyltransferase-like protein